MLRIVYTLMSCTHLGNCKCLQLLLPRLLPLLLLLLPLRLHLPRQLRLWPPLLLLVQVGYNGLER